MQLRGRGVVRKNITWKMAIALFAAVTQSRRRCRYLTQQKTLAARLSNVRTQSQSRCRINQINCGNRMQRVAAVLKCWKGLEKLRFAFCLLQLVQLHNIKQSRTATHSSRRLDRVSCPAFSLQCSSQCELNGQSRAASPRSLTWRLCKTFRFSIISKSV